ncbi:MAG: T9SS type A sorting domain-containing protein [Bacteroidota bacterium]
MNKVNYFLIVVLSLFTMTITAQEEWNQVGSSILGADSGDELGHSVSLSSDGSVMAVAAPNNGDNNGQVIIYQNTIGSWEQIGSPISGESGDRSGYSVSLNSEGSIVAIGSPTHGENSPGCVRIYQNIDGVWTQIGDKIDGKIIDNQFGRSVSLSSDGLTLAAGAVENGTTEAGHVGVYKLIDGSWQQMGLDITGESGGDQFGSAVSISSDGSAVAVGAPYNTIGGTLVDVGHVRVYMYSNNEWIQTGLDIDGETAGDKFGSSVSLSNDGSLLAIGAPDHDDSNFGHVKIYQNNNNEWEQVGETIEGKLSHNYAGTSVSLSSDGSMVAIGGVEDNDLNRSPGYVMVYRNNGGAWQQAGPDIQGATDGDKFGKSVSLSSDGKIVAIGIPGFGPDQGSTEVYELSGEVVEPPTIDEEWVQVGSSILGADSGDELGHSVSLSSDGSVMAVAAPYNGDNNGLVIIYQNIAGSWEQIGLSISGESGDRSGYSVSLNSEGSIVAIGSPTHGENSPGCVRIYQNIDGVWTQIGDKIDGKIIGNQFGRSVSLSSDGLTLAAGAVENGTTEAGHVGVYKLIDGSWQQMGLDITGESGGDQFGSAVSISSDGSAVAVGAPYNTIGGTLVDVGHVRVYMYSNNEWIQTGLDIDGETAGDKFGSSVSLSNDGSLLAIGAPDHDDSNFGHVKIYQNNNNEWEQVGETIEGKLSHNYAGTSVSLSSDGSMVAIGGVEDNDLNRSPGYVMVYRNNGGAWQQAGPDIQGATDGDKFGKSVSLSSDGKIVAIGIPGFGPDQGSAEVYELVETPIEPPMFEDDWVQIGLDMVGEASGDEFGHSVSMSYSGSIVAIGAPDYEQNKGQVRIYKDISNSWKQLGLSIIGESWDHSGSSVSLNSDGSIVAIGSPTHGENSLGCVRIYQNIDGAWTQMGDKIDGKVLFNQFGRSVSLSFDGLTVAVGAVENVITEAGHVGVYQFIDGAWQQLGLDITGEEVGDQFGRTVSLSSDGSTVAVGAPYNTIGWAFVDVGHVRVYRFNNNEWIQIGSDIDGEAAGDKFGSSVSLSIDASILAIGAPDYDDSNYGHVKVYQNNNNEWEQVGETIEGKLSHNYAGTSVSLSSDGSTVAIGGAEDNDLNRSPGYVMVYKNVEGTWHQMGVNILGAENGDKFGKSVSINSDGTKVAVGAPGFGPDQGLAGVYNYGELDPPLSNFDISSEKVMVYPNPTSGNVIINNINKERLSVRLFTINGVLVVESMSEEEKVRIDLGNYQAGMYIMHIENGNDKEIIKVIKY